MRDELLKYHTDNNFEIRNELRRLNFPCLNFSTKGKYIKLGFSNWANASKSWVEEYSYAFEDIKDTEYINFDELVTLINKYNKNV